MTFYSIISGKSRGPLINVVFPHKCDDGGPECDANATLILIELLGRHMHIFALDAR